MLRLVFKFLWILMMVAGTAHTYQNDYRNQKSTYLNYQLQRFRQRNPATTTDKPRTYLAPVHHKLRHTNNRFPKMDSILSRIDSSESVVRRTTTESPPVLRWTTDAPYIRRYTTTTVKADDPSDYVDFDDESDSVFTKKSEDLLTTADWDDEDLDEDEDDDDDDEEGESEDWQAEEATETPTERTLTEYKWKHYGTRARVEESRRNQDHLNNNRKKEISEAVEHYKKMNVEGSCKIPRAKIINIQHAYPDASKAYLPHCTILHRCADDTGCCKLESQTCAPKHTSRIELFFYTNIMDRSQPSGVEKLAFYNHTECHCIERTQEMMSRDSADHAVDNSNNKYPFRPSAIQRPVIAEALPAPEPIRRCRCPDLYTPQTQHGNGHNCRCDCATGNRDCVRIRRGKEFFSLKDRLCIKNGDCGYPVCEFGVYIRSSGRCPRKQEKLDAFSRISFD